MYSTLCNCGYEIRVTPAMCGSSTACPSCDQAVLVPSLSKLKRDAGESVSMDSTADQVALAVKERRPPFDGRCQICSEAPASTLLPAQFRFLEERILTGSEVTPSGLGVSIGYAPCKETWRTVDLPCFFCDACSVAFLKNWQRSWLNSTTSRVVRMIWVIPAAIIAIVLIALLPFVGWTVGVFIIYAIYKNLTRKRADQFLDSHIRGLGIAGKLLEEDEYFLEWGPFRRVS